MNLHDAVNERIRALPLKEMDGTLLAEGIIAHAEQANRQSDAFDQAFNINKLRDAIALASYLHREQTRSVRANLPRTHYIEHPLRNALRLLRYGVHGQSVIVAAILHDVVEDCAPELSRDFLETAVPGVEEQDDRLRALLYLGLKFGYEARDIIEAVSNPPLPEGLTKAQKRVAYAKHVEAAIADPKVALVKLVDFIDNGAGLHHQASEANFGMISHLSQKYLPLVPVFQARIERDDIGALVSDEGFAKIVKQLDRAATTLATLAILR